MTAGDLQEMLAELGRLMDAGRAERTVVNDLKSFAAGLRPYSKEPLAAFTRQLGNLNRNGASAAPPPPAPVAALADEARDLYDRAHHPDVIVDQIQAWGGRLGGLSKDGLVTIAERLGMVGMKSTKKKKDDIQAAIVDRILVLKRSAIRRDNIGHPPGRANGAG